jgi:hypothetical protein
VAGGFVLLPALDDELEAAADARVPVRRDGTAAGGIYEWVVMTLPRNGWFCYLHPSIMPPVIILPLKTRTSNKTTMTVPMMISTVLVLVVVVVLM